VVDVLRELVAHFDTNLVIRLADVAVAAAKPFRPGTVSISHTMRLPMAAFKPVANVREPVRIPRIEGFAARDTINKYRPEILATRCRM
jgi:hypothetical protein